MTRLETDPNSGNVASCIDAGGTTSEYRYDQKDNLVEVRRHGVVKETYVCDAAGNLLAKHDGDGRELLRFQIGPGNLPIVRTLASGDEHTFQYNLSGQPLLVATKKDRVEFTYDALGNRLQEKRNGKGVEHAFPGWRKLAESIFFDRFFVRRGNTLIVTDPRGKTHEFQFHGNGIVERRFGNGSGETAQYDSLGRCLFKCTWRRGQSWRRRYHWSGEGELSRVEDNHAGEVRHAYDAAHRLKRRFEAGRVEHYDFDIADNVLAQPGLEAVTLLEGNRLSGANGSRFEYNLRNHIEVRRGSAAETRYFYDSRDQLIRVEAPEGLWEADYDAFGRRTRKNWCGRTTEYYWSSDQLVAEVQNDGGVRLYIYADLLGLTPFLILDYDSIEAEPGAGRCYFIFSDQIGTPCLIEDQQQQEVWRARIAPFGHAQIAAGAKTECHLRFPGHYADPELALHYNRFRYYDPRLARYIQSDPWGISGGFNLYAYVSNPLCDVDVRGLGGEENNKDKKKGEGGVPDKEGANGAKSGSEPPEKTPTPQPSAPAQGEAPPVTPTHNEAPGNQAPFKGDPGSTVRGGTQSRTYGPDGFPQTDRDLPHPDESGIGAGDHCHDWGRPAGGGPPTAADRGLSRLPQPGDPPPPRGPNVPPPTK